MTLNLAALQRQLTEKQDLAAIPQMSPEERAAKLAEYQATVDQFAGEERQAFEKVDPQHVPDSWTLRTLKTAMLLHRAAQKSLERLQRAIAKAEKTERSNIPGLTLDAQTHYEQTKG